MPKALIFDPDDKRLAAIHKSIEVNFKDFEEIRPVNTANAPPQSEDVLALVSKLDFEIIAGFLYGNPDAKDVITAYKSKNKSGKVVLYTTNNNISVRDFKDYRFANDMIEIRNPATDSGDRRAIIGAIAAAIAEGGIALSDKSPNEMRVGELLSQLRNMFGRLKPSEFWKTLGVIGAGVAAIIALVFFLGTEYRDYRDYIQSRQATTTQ